MSLEKLSLEDDFVKYETSDGRTHEFDALEFMALLSAHIPNTYESTTRYYGYYSSRARGERKKRAALTLSQELPELEVQPSQSWATCMKQVFELNPLECPRCGSEMPIISFLTDTREIKKIMDSLGIPDYRAPPPLPHRMLYPKDEQQDFFHAA